MAEELLDAQRVARDEERLRGEHGHRGRRVAAACAQLGTELLPRGDGRERALAVRRREVGEAGEDRARGRLKTALGEGDELRDRGTLRPLRRRRARAVRVDGHEEPDEVLALVIVGRDLQPRVEERDHVLEARARRGDGLRGVLGERRRDLDFLPARAEGEDRDPLEVEGAAEEPDVARRGEPGGRAEEVRMLPARVRDEDADEPAPPLPVVRVERLEGSEIAADDARDRGRMVLALLHEHDREETERRVAAGQRERPLALLARRGPLLDGPRRPPERDREEIERGGAERLDPHEPREQDVAELAALARRERGIDEQLEQERRGTGREGGAVARLRHDAPGERDLPQVVERARAVEAFEEVAGVDARRERRELRLRALVEDPGQEEEGRGLGDGLAERRLLRGPGHGEERREEPVVDEERGRGVGFDAPLERPHVAHRIPEEAESQVRRKRARGERARPVAEEEVERAGAHGARRRVRLAQRLEGGERLVVDLDEARLRVAPLRRDRRPERGLEDLLEQLRDRHRAPPEIDEHGSRVGVPAGPLDLLKPEEEPPPRVRIRVRPAAEEHRLLPGIRRARRVRPRHQREERERGRPSHRAQV